jgi:hypothetical protein
LKAVPSLEEPQATTTAQATSAVATTAGEPGRIHKR